MLTLCWSKIVFFLSTKSTRWPRNMPKCFFGRGSARTHLGELTTLSRPSSRLGRGHPSQTSLHSAPSAIRSSRLRRSPLVPPHPSLVPPLLRSGYGPALTYFTGPNRRSLKLGMNRHFLAS